MFAGVLSIRDRTDWGVVWLYAAGLMHAGTSMLPSVAMGTSLASSQAYCRRFLRGGWPTQLLRDTIAVAKGGLSVQHPQRHGHFRAACWGKWDFR